MFYIVTLYCFVRAPSPPPKRMKPNEDEEESEGQVSNVIQGEIARLDQRFRLNLDPIHHNGSKIVHLICKLGKSS